MLMTRQPLNQISQPIKNIMGKISTMYRWQLKIKMDITYGKHISYFCTTEFKMNNSYAKVMITRYVG